MVSKALVTHDKLFRAHYISRPLRWATGKVGEKKKKEEEAWNKDMISNYVLQWVENPHNGIEWKERNEEENMNHWWYAKILVISWVYPERLVIFLTHSYKEKNNFLAEVISRWS